MQIKQVSKATVEYTQQQDTLRPILKYCDKLKMYAAYCFLTLKHILYIRRLARILKQSRKTQAAWNNIEKIANLNNFYL